MFDTQKIGEKIAQFRRKKNMTQMELAEEMSVSFQAVSSWEHSAVCCQQPVSRSACSSL